MTKRKVGRDKFWCPECRKVGYRTEDRARAVALLAPSSKVVFPCPEGRGWHFGPFVPKPGGDPAG